jgi:hypothetical protein
VIRQVVVTKTESTPQVGPDEMAFETQTSRKDKKSSKRKSSANSDSEDSLEDIKVPVYLGVTLHEDSKMNVKLREVLQNHLKLLLQDYNSAAVLETVESIS